MNWHPPKWLLYVAIICLGFLMAWFGIAMLTNEHRHVNRQQQQAIEEIRHEAEHKADSLAGMLQVEKQLQQQKVESLSKRVEAVHQKAATEKRQILNRYEKAYKEILQLSDDSLAMLDRRNGPKYDSLFNRYGYQP